MTISQDQQTITGSQPGRQTPRPAVLTWKEDQAPVYPDVVAWVSEWLTPNLERDIKRTFEWCPKWWDHPEAVERLEALWEAWEFGRMDGGPWKGRWWTSHGDRQLAILCSPGDGPFGHCHGEHRTNAKPLFVTPVPDDWKLRPDSPIFVTAAGGSTPSAGTQGTEEVGDE
jgi:Domain of unknown function (DUF4913)